MGRTRHEMIDEISLATSITMTVTAHPTEIDGGKGKWGGKKKVCVVCLTAGKREVWRYHTNVPGLQCTQRLLLWVKAASCRIVSSEGMDG